MRIRFIVLTIFYDSLSSLESFYGGLTPLFFFFNVSNENQNLAFIHARH